MTQPSSFETLDGVIILFVIIAIITFVWVLYLLFLGMVRNGFTAFLCSAGCGLMIVGSWIMIRVVG